MSKEKESTDIKNVSEPSSGLLSKPAKALQHLKSTVEDSMKSNMDDNFNLSEVMLEGRNYISIYGPVFTILFFIGSSMINNDLKGYVLVSVMMLCTVVAYFLIFITDILFRASLGWTSLKPQILKPDQSVSCTSLMFGKYNISKKLNISTYIYVFIATYLLTCANTQYSDTTMLFPKFATFIIFFIFLTVITIVSSTLANCSSSPTTTSTTTNTTTSATEKPSGMGLKATLLYYNILTLLVALLTGYIGARIVASSGNPDFIYYAPKDYTDVCRIADKTQFKCSLEETK